MKLSDGTIIQEMEGGAFSIEPRPKDSQIQPCSVDLSLGNSWCWPDGDHLVGVNYLSLAPGRFILATTLEKITLGRWYMAQVHGKSSWARRGLLVEAAGLVDPGFSGTITLELFNMNRTPIPLSAGDPICQITFERVDCLVDRPYGTPGLNSHYQDQSGATAAR